MAVCLCWMGGSASAQVNLDSLRRLVSEELADTVKLAAYRSLTYELAKYASHDSLETLHHLAAASALAARLADEASAWGLVKIKGDLYYNRGYFAEALGYYQQAAEGTAANPLPEVQQVRVQALNKIGLVHYVQGNNRLALQRLAETYTLAEAIGYGEGMALARLCQGVVYHARQNYTAALRHFEDCLAQYRALDDQNGVAYALNNLGAIHDSQGQYDSALYYYRQSLALKQATQDQYGLGTAYYNLGIVQAYLGRYDSAALYYHRSLQCYRDFEDDREQASVLVDLGMLYLKQNRIDTASRCIEEAFALCKANGYTQDLQEHFQKVGNWYTQQGRIPEALGFYTDALALARQMTDTLGQAKVYALMAKVYARQKDLNMASRYIRQAYTYYTQVHHVSGQASTTATIGQWQVHLGEYTEAALLARKSLIYYQELGDTCAMASGYLTLGQAYLGMQQPDSARAILSTAARIARQCRQYSELSRVYISLGAALAQMGRDAASLRVYEQALAYADTAQDRHQLKEAAEHLYRLYEARGDLARAYATFKVYHTNQDSLFNEDNTRKLVEQEMAFAYAEKQREQEVARLAKDLAQQKALERQRWVIYGGGGLLVLLGILAFSFYRHYRTKVRANVMLRVQNEKIQRSSQEITEKNEEITRQKAELEALDQAKSRFFANLSHELRTPLTLISGPVDEMLNCPEGLSPKRWQKLKVVARNCQQLRGLVDDIMRLSKLEASQHQVHAQALALAPILQRAIANFESMAKHQQVALKLEVDDSLGPWLWLDGEKLQKVLNNLLSNALKHTPPGGGVTLRVSLAEERLCLAVQDTGRGIPEREQARIFDRYYQSTQPEAPLQGGTGIGLALVRELARVMGGTIALSSAEGEGSTFTLCLPYQPVAAPEEYRESEDQVNEEVPTPPRGPAQAPYQVLVVEDHPDMQHFVAGLLAAEYGVHTARNGREALELLDREPIDLVVSDVMMPEMDGYALLEKLKATDRLCGIPVVMLTALAGESHTLKGLALGVDDYLAKPFSPPELLARVRNLLARREQRLYATESNPSAKATAKQVVTELGEALEEVGVQPADLAWLKKVETRLQQELENEDFNLTLLAEEFHLSERQFRRKLKQITGLSPKKYQQELALQKARALLEQGVYHTITAVAETVGINNATRLSQLYVARFGKHPQEYMVG